MIKGLYMLFIMHLQYFMLILYFLQKVLSRQARNPCIIKASGHIQTKNDAVSEWLKQATRGSAILRDIWGQAKTECRRWRIKSHVIALCCSAGRFQAARDSNAMHNQCIGANMPLALPQCFHSAHPARHYSRYANLSVQLFRVFATHRH